MTEENKNILQKSWSWYKGQGIAVKVLVVIAALLAFSKVSSGGELNCENSDAKNTLISIITEKLDNQVSEKAMPDGISIDGSTFYRIKDLTSDERNSIDVDISNIMTADYNREIKQYKCQAKAELYLNKNAPEKVKGEGYQANISYIVDQKHSKIFIDEYSLLIIEKAIRDVASTYAKAVLPEKQKICDERIAKFDAQYQYAETRKSLKDRTDDRDCYFVPGKENQKECLSRVRDAHQEIMDLDKKRKDACLHI